MNPNHVLAQKKNKKLLKQGQLQTFLKLQLKSFTTTFKSPQTRASFRTLTVLIYTTLLAYTHIQCLTFSITTASPVISYASKIASTVPIRAKA